MDVVKGFTPDAPAAASPSPYHPCLPTRGGGGSRTAPLSGQPAHVCPRLRVFTGRMTTRRSLTRSASERSILAVAQGRDQGV
jgi:hypothetical protein